MSRRLLVFCEVALNKSLDYIFPNPPAISIPSQLDAAAVPQHVAVIMDGNGRWAKERGKNRLFGHKAGIEAVRETIAARPTWACAT